MPLLRYAARVERSIASPLVFLGIAGCSGAPLAPPVAGLAPDAGAERVQARAGAIPKGYTLLHAFTGSPDGATPYGGVIVVPKGNIFGTTYAGGTSTPPSGGAGTVFELQKKGGSYVESVVHDFGTDGYNAATAPTEDPSGNLYATVQSGPQGVASGGVVELSPSSNGYNESSRFAFDGASGSLPFSQLLEVPEGSLGVTPSIGAGTILFTTAMGGGATGNGSIAALQLDLSYADAYDFKGVAAGDGAAPMGNLVIDPTRTMYGATSAGGVGSGAGNGTVYEFTPDSGNERVLYSFAGGTADGRAPAGGVVLDVEGNLYGTTQYGGANDRGTIFKLTYAAGTFKETILHSFGGAKDGATPLAAPVITLRSNILYGTTSAGGANGAGTLYQISTNGSKYKVLYDFSKSTGATPGYGSLFLSGNALFGTTMLGGSANDGVVYRFVP